jgi:hypothetical protein
MREFELDHDVDPVEIIAEIHNRVVEKGHQEILCFTVAACIVVVVAAAVWHVVAVYAWVAATVTAQYTAVVQETVAVSG